MMVSPDIIERLDFFCAEVLADRLRSLRKDEIYDFENYKKGMFEEDIKEIEELLIVFNATGLTKSKNEIIEIHKEFKRQVEEEIA